jgi:hypothetical protein
MTREKATEIAERWFESREWSEECYCADGEEGTCWYHLGPELQRQARIRSLVDLLVAETA